MDQEINLLATGFVVCLILIHSLWEVFSSSLIRSSIAQKKISFENARNSICMHTMLQLRDCIFQKMMTQRLIML